MAEGATFTPTQIKYHRDYIIAISWEAGADGALDASNQSPVSFYGKIYGGLIVPDNGTAPTSGYDLFVYDEVDPDGDRLQGQGVGLSSGTDKNIVDLIVPVSGKLTLSAADAGNGGNGILYLWFQGTIE